MELNHILFQEKVNILGLLAFDISWIFSHLSLHKFLHHLHFLCSIAFIALKCVATVLFIEKSAFCNMLRAFRFFSKIRPIFYHNRQSNSAARRQNSPLHAKALIRPVLYNKLGHTTAKSLISCFLVKI